MGDHSELRDAHAALDRMARAHKRGTGCHLTADMIHALGVTMIGQMWGEENPLKDENDD